MLFHTPTFLIFFLLFCTCYFPAGNRQVRGLVLLVFSNVFYGWWDWKYLALLWLTIFIDYGVALAMGSAKQENLRKIYVTISLVTNLAILGVFKYFNFFIDSTVQLTGINISHFYISSLLLPVGLSFYTFQSISYTLDVYRRKKEPVRSLLDYATFVCYFPQLVAGPIERIGHLLPQIIEPLKPTPERVSDGVLLFCFGFFRKAMADTFAVTVNPIFQNLAGASPAEVVFGVIGFGLQIYFDFAGYTDMARGISKIMGIDLMINFKTPYFSLSPQEFWRRWHISLSLWLRDYLYISLGGSRRGYRRHLRNLMITMVLGGLWHGAGFNFMIWGALHGAYLCANVVLAKRYPTMFAPERMSLFRSMVAGCVTFILVNYAWLYFRCQTLADSIMANRKIAVWLLHPKLPTIYSGFLALVIVLIAIEIGLRWFEKRNYQKPFVSNAGTAAMQDIVSGILFVLGFLFLAGVPTQQFIYFQF